MPPRPSWSGYLKLSLISVPVKAYTATGSGVAIPLHQLHEECHSRIKYVKTCPIHGEVTKDEIVSGYEFAKGEYVVIDTDELDKLRSERDKSISVETFVSEGTIDPIYHSGRTYYLVPDGPVGQKPYALLLKTMQESHVQAVAQVVISQREQLVLLRPIEQLLGMTVLEYAARIKKPDGLEDEISKAAGTASELNLMKTLIEALTREDFDIASYTDKYVERLSQLIEAKVEGKELVSPPQSEEPHVINLMDALKASVKRVKDETGMSETAPARPPNKMAASAPKRSAAAKKPAKRKKSG